MPADDEPQPLTAPVLTHARMEWSDGHPNGTIRLAKKDGNGTDIKSVGWVRGVALQRGWTVDIQKNNKKKTWQGTITAGPDLNQARQQFWTFEVQNKDDLPDPTEEETLTLTVTNTSGETSLPIVSDPQPDVVP